MVGEFKVGFQNSYIVSGAGIDVCGIVRRINVGPKDAYVVGYR